MTPEFGRLLVHRQQVNRSIESISVNIYFLYYTYIDDGGKRQKFGMSDATSSPQVALFMFDGGEGGSIFYQKKLTYWNVSQSRMQNVLFMLLGSIQLNSKKWCLVQEEKKRGGGNASVLLALSFHASSTVACSMLCFVSTRTTPASGNAASAF